MNNNNSYINIIGRNNIWYGSVTTILFRNCDIRNNTETILIAQYEIQVISYAVPWQLIYNYKGTKEKYRYNEIFLINCEIGDEKFIDTCNYRYIGYRHIEVWLYMEWVFCKIWFKSYQERLIIEWVLTFYRLLWLMIIFQ